MKKLEQDKKKERPMTRTRKELEQDKKNDKDKERTRPRVKILFK